MKIYIVALLGTAFVLSLCLACDDKCDVKTFPDEILSYVGEYLGGEESIWLKFEESFRSIVIQLKIDTKLDSRGDKIYHQSWKISREQLRNSIPEEKWNDWHNMNAKVVKKEVSFLPDPLIIEVYIDGHEFIFETSLWWRLNIVKSVQVLVEGGAEGALDCHPCEKNIHEEEWGTETPVIETNLNEETPNLPLFETSIPVYEPIILIHEPINPVYKPEPNIPTPGLINPIYKPNNPTPETSTQNRDLKYDPDTLPDLNPLASLYGVTKNLAKFFQTAFTFF